MALLEMADDVARVGKFYSIVDQDRQLAARIEPAYLARRGGVDGVELDTLVAHRITHLDAKRRRRFLVTQRPELVELNLSHDTNLRQPASATRSNNSSGQGRGFRTRHKFLSWRARPSEPDSRATGASACKRLK
jgi:hypothetical protein